MGFLVHLSRMTVCMGFKSTGWQRRPASVQASPTFAVLRLPLLVGIIRSWSGLPYRLKPGKERLTLDSLATVYNRMKVSYIYLHFSKWGSYEVVSNAVYRRTPLLGFSVDSTTPLVSHRAFVSGQDAAPWAKVLSTSSVPLLGWRLFPYTGPGSRWLTCFGLWHQLHMKLHWDFWLL